jgi:hypothetical protein
VSGTNREKSRKVYSSGEPNSANAILAVFVYVIIPGIDLM